MNYLKILIFLAATGDIVFKPLPLPRPRFYNGEETTSPVLLFWLSDQEYGDLDHSGTVNLRDWYMWNYQFDENDRIKYRQKIVQQEKKAKARKRIITYK